MPTCTAIRHSLFPGTLVCAALASSGCLVVSPPEYEQPAQTAPYLVGTKATPSLGTLIKMDERTEVLTFGGAVLSEDNNARVKFALYIDYGQENAAKLPYRNRYFPVEREIEPGTLAQGPREFGDVEWFTSIVPIPKGCHTVTLMASHDFDSRACPARVADDSSYLVWRVVNCEAMDTSCATEECLQPTCSTAPCASCATLPSDSGAGGAGP